MRYTVNLLLGPALGQASNDLKKLVATNGEDRIDSFLQVIHWQADEARMLEETHLDRSESDKNSFEEIQISPQEQAYDVSKDENIQLFFSNLYNRTLTVNSQEDDDTIGLSIIFCLFDKEAVNTAIRITRLLDGIPQRFKVDFIGLHYDLAYLFQTKDENKNLASKIAELKQISVDSIKARSEITANCFHRYIVIQNCNATGVSMNFDYPSLIKILGEYAMICIENYHSIYPQSEEFEKKDITSIGVSLLFFDKYYFVHYLLRSVYLSVFENEDIAQDEVDVNKVSKVAQEKLSKHTSILSTFYDKEILPLTRNEVAPKEIIVQITPKFNLMMDEILKDLQSYIDDPNLSLPEKRVVLAQILGQDDELTSGYSFDKDLLTIDDCNTEALKIYIEANNKLVSQTIDEKGQTVIIPGVLKPNNRESGEVTLGLNELKTLKHSLLESTTFIREKSKDLSSLSDNLELEKESESRLTDDGFKVGGITYKVLHEVAEKPFENTYAPSSDSKKNESIDLRPGFTPIKNQGELGACTIFSISSIYEFILKKSAQKESDLSERFVYYNVCDAHPTQAKEGTSYYDVIDNIINKGICSERYCPYDSSKIAIAPSSEAYKDAETHKIKVAKNVRITHDDFISALSEGYPIAIALKIYDSFANCPGGFVAYPSDEEIKSGHFGGHAMVVCGYSMKDKVYIVRNSWGNSWGDNGYCYIPFNYIEDEELNDFACIIASINEGEDTKGFEQFTTVSFNETDSIIRYAILRNLINEEKNKMSVSKGLYDELMKEYEEVVQSLGNNSTRNEISEKTIDRLEKEISAKIKERDEFNTIKREEEFQAFNKQKTKEILVQLGVMLVLLLIWIFGFYLSDEWLSKTFSWAIVALFGLSVLFFVSYLPYKKKKLRELKEELDETSELMLKEISRLKGERSTFQLRSYLAGMFLDKFTKFKNSLMAKYAMMKSYVGNLSGWYSEEKKNFKNMEPVSKRDSFVPLISNEALDSYFSKNRDALANDIHLYQLFDAYDVDENSVVKFKAKIENIVRGRLLSIIKDFSVYKHISGLKEYPYLNRENANLEKLLSLLDPRSKVFLQTHITTIDSNKIPSQYIFIHTDTPQEKIEWSNNYPHYFNIAPTACETVSLFKLVVFQKSDYDLEDVL